MKRNLKFGVKGDGRKKNKCWPFICLFLWISVFLCVHLVYFSCFFIWTCIHCLLCILLFSWLKTHFTKKLKLTLHKRSVSQISKWNSVLHYDHFSSPRKRKKNDLKKKIILTIWLWKQTNKYRIHYMQISGKNHQLLECFLCVTYFFLSQFAQAGTLYCHVLWCLSLFCYLFFLEYTFITSHKITFCFLVSL